MKMMMKNPSRKRRKASPSTETAASDPDLDPSTCKNLQIPVAVDTADGECDSRSAADLHKVTECGGRSRNLYVYSQTLDCVLQKQCIPCLYKLFPDGRNDRYLRELLLSSTGIDESKKDTSSAVGSRTGTMVRSEEYPTNTRPELCSRSGLMPISKIGRGSAVQLQLQLDLMTNIYGARLTAADLQSEHAVLTVGDGDFTFSLSLAETDRFQQSIDNNDSSSSSVGCHAKSRGCSTRLKLTATSHESYQSICSTYPQAVGTLNRLKHLGATVLHEVDATDLHGAPFAAVAEGSSSSSSSSTFDFIIWNFPCVSLPAGADGQTSELEQNRALLRRFFSNIRPFLTADRGEVHITHKTIVSTYSTVMLFSLSAVLRTARSRYTIDVV